MLAFLQNLLPRLRQFSQSLDQTELFVDKPWVLIDEDGRQQTYIFRRGGELLMSLDGHVQMGKWDYIAPAQSLLIDRGVDKLLLNHFFFTDALLVLAWDGRPESKFVLANRQIIPDLNINEYLLALESKQNMQLKNPAVLKYPALRFSIKTTCGLLLECSTKTGAITIDDETFVEGEPAQDGRYVSERSWGVVIKDGLVKNVFWPKPYGFKTGQEIIVDCRGQLIAPNQPDRVFWLSGSPVEDGKYSIEGVGKVRIRGGCIDGFPLF